MNPEEFHASIDMLYSISDIGEPIDLDVLYDIYNDCKLPHITPENLNIIGDMNSMFSLVYTFSIYSYVGKMDIDDAFKNPKTKEIINHIFDQDAGIENVDDLRTVRIFMDVVKKYVACDDIKKAISMLDAIECNYNQGEEKELINKIIDFKTSYSLLLHRAITNEPKLVANVEKYGRIDVYEFRNYCYDDVAEITELGSKFTTAEIKDITEDYEYKPAATLLYSYMYLKAIMAENIVMNALNKCNEIIDKNITIEI